MISIHPLATPEEEEAFNAMAANNLVTPLVHPKLNPQPPHANAKQVGGDHYKKMGVQVWDVVDTWPREQRIGYYRGNALKYIMRLGTKDEEAQETGKGIHYLEKLLEVLKKP